MNCDQILRLERLCEGAPINKAVLSPSAGTAIPLPLHASPKPRRYVSGQS